MFLPPTMLPHSLRVLVDPPIQFPEVLDDPRQLVASSRWSRLRSTFSWTRPTRAAAPTIPPCEDAVHLAPTKLLGRPKPCAD